MSRKDTIDEHWEARINALLDGELAEDEIAALKAEAEHNRALARAIVDAHAVQAMIEDLEIERAPASLRKKLSRIPRTESAGNRTWLGMPGWAPVGAMAAIPLVVIAMVMMQPGPSQPEYTQAEVLRARQEVLTAFAYLDRIGERTGRKIENELAEELSDSVNDTVGRYMPFTHQSEQEEES